MSIIAVRYNGTTIPIELVDIWVSGGIRYATVKALEGMPFVGGNKWPVHTPYNIVKVSDITIEEDCTCGVDGDACPVCVITNTLQGIYFDEATNSSWGVIPEVAK